jgi:hypothetical protein
MPKRNLSASLPASIAKAAQTFREQTREAMGRMESVSTRIEELMARTDATDATFLGGSLLPMMSYALLHQAREETREAIANLEKQEPSDIVDHADFFAAAVGEFAALLKILATMEVESNAALKEDWEKLADDLQALATILQRATEKFEDAIEAVEPLVNIQIK